MLSSQNEFIIDAVAHPYNHSPDNYIDVMSCATICELAYHFSLGAPDQRYHIPHDVYVSDWSVEDVANVLFRETATDMAIVHTLPFYGFKDGYCSIEKSAEAVERWPNRFRAYAAIDPLWGKAALDELDRQVELLHPTGIKVYPVSWNGETLSRWKMDDPKIAFPLYERALELGIKVIAVHKAVPVGPVVTGDAFHPHDLEGAAGAFPDLSFEIVHGGIAFAEETAWLMARFPNIYVNLEVLNLILERRPRTFAKVLLDLVKVGGMPMFDRLIWATGCVVAHPREGLEAFCRFEFPEDLLDGAGLFAPIEQLTDDHKRNILAGTCARLHGIDLDATKKAIADDEFSRARADDREPEPWSTCSKWKQIEEARQVSPSTPSVKDLSSVVHGAPA